MLDFMFVLGTGTSKRVSEYPINDIPPEFLMQDINGLERSRCSLCRCGNETELFQQGHHIVVGVETDDLVIPDLNDLAEPQFDRAPRRWNSSRLYKMWVLPKVRRMSLSYTSTLLNAFNQF